MADDDSLLHINLQDLKNELNEDTAIDELLELLKYMQEEWKADAAASHNQLEELRGNNEALQIDIDILRNGDVKYKNRIKELEDQHRIAVERLMVGRSSETSTSGHRGPQRRK
jgi:predicted nuclease with TOPRIM domain